MRRRTYGEACDVRIWHRAKRPNWGRETTSLTTVVGPDAHIRINVFGLIGKAPGGTALSMSRVSTSMSRVSTDVDCSPAREQQAP